MFFYRINMELFCPSKVSLLKKRKNTEMEKSKVCFNLNVNVILKM